MKEERQKEMDYIELEMRGTALILEELTKVSKILGIVRYQYDPFNIREDLKNQIQVRLVKLNHQERMRAIHEIQALLLELASVSGREQQ